MLTFKVTLAMSVRSPQPSSLPIAELPDEGAPASVPEFIKVAKPTPREGNAYGRAASKPLFAPVNNPAPSASNREARKAESEEDHALVQACKTGDSRAFRTLVERHQRRAFTLALSLVRDENDARELVQEAFLRAYKNLPMFQGSSSFFTWFYRIVTNLSIDLLRKPGRQNLELDEQRSQSDELEESSLHLISHNSDADPLDAVHRGQLAARIQTALDALPPYHRSVIVMREVEGMSYDEMADAMGVSKGTIMSRLFHARQKLQRALEDLYQETQGQMPPACSSSSQRGAS